MQIVGIICEYNPLHLGHQKQMDWIRRQLGPDTAIVCLMSGNFVQRGHPAIFDKSLRARAALRCGADLVIELPQTVALSSAEGFAAGGVEILGRFCDYLCFGAETDRQEALTEIARGLLSPDFSQALRRFLDAGLSFPAARQKALEAMGLEGSLLTRPNNILAAEYCKAMLAQDTGMKPLVIQRQGDYHDERPDPENPSATALRRIMLRQDSWEEFVPRETVDIFRHAPLHDLAAGERAMLCKLRCMTEPEFQALPYGSEGLWRKLMHACREETTLEAILTAVKSKRYTRTRLDRMVMCACLGIDKERLEAPAPYARVLGFSDRGRKVLKIARQTGRFPNAGEPVEDPLWQLEQRWGDLYGLFCVDRVESPGSESRRRIEYPGETK